MTEEIKDVNSKIDDLEAAKKKYASADTVISIGGYEFTPAKLMVAFTLVSSVLGGLYGTFEVYKDYMGMKKKIAEYGQKAKDGKLGIEELTGGTFSISNGGTFGSMLSTPIINPPQSAILGVHATKDRAVVENGQVVVRPMNYLAMSYDHRLIDGREAVLGLVAMKEVLEDPSRLLLDL